MSKTPTLDVKSFLSAFGGKQKVIQLMRKKFAVNLSKKQVDKWVERNSIPGSYLVALEVVGKALKPNVKILDHTN